MSFFEKIFGKKKSIDSVDDSGPGEKDTLSPDELGSSEVEDQSESPSPAFTPEQEAEAQRKEQERIEAVIRDRIARREEGERELKRWVERFDEVRGHKIDDNGNLEPSMRFLIGSLDNKLWEIRNQSLYEISNILWDHGTSDIGKDGFDRIASCMKDKDPIVAEQAMFTFLYFVVRAGTRRLAELDGLEIIEDLFREDLMTTYACDWGGMLTTIFADYIRNGFATEDMIRASIPGLLQTIEWEMKSLDNVMLDLPEPVTNGSGLQMTIPPGEAPIELSKWPWEYIMREDNPLQIIAKKQWAGLLVHHYSILELLSYNLRVFDKRVNKEAREIMEALCEGGLADRVVMCLKEIVDNPFSSNHPIRVDENNDDLPLEERQSFKIAQVICETKIPFSKEGPRVNLEDVLVIQPRVEVFVKQHQDEMVEWAKMMIEKWDRPDNNREI